MADDRLAQAEENRVARAEENKATIRNVYDAIARGDRDSIGLLVDPDLVIVRPAGHPAGGTFKGRAAAAEARQRNHALLGPTKVEIRELIAEGSARVVVVMDISGVGAAGEAWSLPAVELADIADGKVVKIQLFVDTARLREIAETRQASQAPMETKGR
jgi:ketosteroid isomerase-like protein